ncbi:MarR family winged helix-turn-helix transcriptional regulator [Gaiella sp.]|jgi:DNA-binding MarR family transcriptional regulator|uniref:MarR family winged helix-turn-helix transcriptional regulator n=1 Tax=Gaiella sp. TaxID=2663207 RepID=UPI002E37FEDB|nr:MarR family transcriptional regulator [Gaiella sp.]HEX5583237.1 MarR family transcriptional regulator [Gaiella sp.]
MVSEATLSAKGIAEELRPVVLRVARRIRREAEHLGVTSHQATLLWLVRTRPGLSLRELAQAEGISAPSLSAHVDRLESLGLIRRVRSSDDRRRVGLELTPEGRTTLRRIRAGRTTWLAERLEQLSDEQRQRLEQALPALEALLEPEPPR